MPALAPARPGLVIVLVIWGAVWAATCHHRRNQQAVQREGTGTTQSISCVKVSEQCSICYTEGTAEKAYPYGERVVRIR